MEEVKTNNKRVWKNSEFVHCHCHSVFSIGDSTCRVKDLVKKARHMGFTALAITDHGSVASFHSFISACTATKDKDGNLMPDAPIKPILGTEIYFARELNGNKDTQPDGQRGNKHLIILAKDWDGYKNLCTLSHISWVEGFYFEPRIDFDTLSKHSKGLVVSSACLSGLINSNLRYGRYEEAKKIASIFKDILREDFFLEIMYHGIAEEYKIISLIIKLGAELEIPIIATNDCHYLEKPDAPIQDLYVCSGHNTTIENPNRMRHPYPELYLKSAQEMAEIFGDYPQFLTNTLSVAERIDNKEIEKNLFGVNRFPTFPITKGFKDQYEYLCSLAWKGLKDLGWHNKPDHVEALKKELNDVKLALESANKDFSSNFLIVRDCNQFAKEAKIQRGFGRGSGFASVLLRCLGIFSGPSPIEYGLLWERFLGFDEIFYMLDSDLGFDTEEKHPEVVMDTEDIEEEDLPEDEDSAFD